MHRATSLTPRLRLVPLGEEHLEDEDEDEDEVDADPQVMRYLGSGRALARHEVEQRHRDRLAAAPVVPGLGLWAGPSAAGPSAGGC